MSRSLEYIGSDKPDGWYEKEQEVYLRQQLGDELFEYLDEIERERKERDTQRNSRRNNLEGS